MTEPATLRELAYAVRRLSPHHHDPERFHIEKDAIERQLRRMANIAEREQI